MSTTTTQRELKRKRPWPKRVTAALGWGLFALLAVLMWPVALGGATSYVIVTGHSMEPTLHPGDVAVLRTGDYEVGDVVSYRPFPDVSAQVIHRIIGFRDDGTVILQGDNNEFVDPYSPEPADVAGKMVFSVPAIGKLVWVLGTPLVWMSLGLLALALLLYPAAKKKPAPPPGTGELAEQDRATPLDREGAETS